MKLKEFIKSAFTQTNSSSGLKGFADTLSTRNNLMPVLFTSHRSPRDIPLSREECPFWSSLHELGGILREKYEPKAILMISAHWCTNGTYVNVSDEQEQVYDYHDFPPPCYEPKYRAKGAPEVAHEVSQIIPSVRETQDWGLDHGAWPLLMHLFPQADVPVFQMSLNYGAKPIYHYELGQQLKSLREQGVLVIGSGALIHNPQILNERMSTGDFSPWGWEAEYDTWLKKQLKARAFEKVIFYESTHPFSSLAAPTPDHFVPVLYPLGMTDRQDTIRFFYDDTPTTAFSELSFIVHR